jgi:hypothetical protein
MCPLSHGIARYPFGEFIPSHDGMVHSLIGPPTDQLLSECRDLIRITNALLAEQ